MRESQILPEADYAHLRGKVRPWAHFPESHHRGPDRDFRNAGILESWNSGFPGNLKFQESAINYRCATLPQFYEAFTCVWFAEVRPLGAEEEARAYRHLQGAEEVGGVNWIRPRIRIRIRNGAPYVTQSAY